jgi:signal transduction histidine kinase
VTSVPVRIVLFLAAAAAAVALTAATPSWDPRLTVGMLAAAAAASLAVTLIAWARYRESRDPQALLMAVGFGALTVQLGFALRWALGTERALLVAPEPGLGGLDPMGESFRAAPFFALQTGWAVVAACCILAVPWWERRGRPPLRWTVVSGGAALVVVVVDWLAAIGAQESGLPPEGTDLGALAVVATAVAVALLAVAAWQHLATPRRSPVYRWNAVALLLAVPWAVAASAHPGIGLGWLQPADGLLIAVPLVALGGLLATQRTEASHMRRATDRAEEVLGGRAEIASTIAHDVRGPVASVASLATTLRTSYERLSDEQRLEFVGMIGSEATRLLRLVDQVALALKVDARTLEYAPSPQRVALIVRRAVEDADTGDHPVVVDADDAVIASVDGRWVAAAIGQGVDNAARFSPDTSPIHVSLRADDGQAIVEIVDEGPGVPLERREEVFGRFARWRPQGYEDRSGSGLGLFLCRAIVREHGGEASLDAAPNGSTILRVRLPAKENEG